MKKEAKLSKSLLLNVILFGFIGQVAWAVENNFFNLYLFNVVGGDSNDISNMVAASSVVAVFATLIMGSLSDKINKRKVFLCTGYIIWGFTVMSFAFINRENVASILNTTPVAATATTVSLVIIMDCVMTFMGSTSNDAAFNAWVTDITIPSNRAKVESLLAILPVLALVVVTVAFGALSTKFGYPACFIGLGLIVTICGVIGIFSVKDSLSGVKSTNSFWECLTYGFRPSVIKENKGLYISLTCTCIFSIACQIFFPYLFIYVDHYIDMNTLKLTVPVIILAVVVIGVSLTVLVASIILSDKKGKIPFLVPSAVFFVVGLVLVYFADSNIIWFALSAVIAMVGYGLLMILINAAVRDFTPEDKAGQLQGVRMIFNVMIPMLIGPRIAAKITELFSTQHYIDGYGEATLIPAPHIYLGAAVVGALIIIPLIFLIKEFKKEQANAK